MFSPTIRQSVLQKSHDPPRKSLKIKSLYVCEELGLHFLRASGKTFVTVESVMFQSVYTILWRTPSFPVFHGSVITSSLLHFIYLSLFIIY